jgi:hypothetical protein
MHQVRVILLLGLIAFTGCDQSRDARLFKPWGWEDVNDGRARLEAYKHVLIAHVDECIWEDRGSHRLTPYHFKATVTKSYKGDWRQSERISFVHYVDAPAPSSSVTNAARNYLVVILANDHTNSEIVLNTGDWLNYSDELVPALEYLYPEKRK